MKRQPTPAGSPITAQGSGEVLAGLLRACNWQRWGGPLAKITILGPRDSQDSNPRRAVIRGWAIHLQKRLANERWQTVSKIGALEGIARIASAGNAEALFGAEVRE
jgi:hypothetical protein